MHEIKELKILNGITICLGLSPAQYKFKKRYFILNYLKFSPIIIQFGIIISIIYTVLANREKYLIVSSFLDECLDCAQIFRILIMSIIQILENISKSRLNDKLNKAMENVDREIFARHLCGRLKSCSFCRKRSLRRFFYTKLLWLPVVDFIIDIIVMGIIAKKDPVWANSLNIREFSATMIRIALVPMLCHFYWAST